MRDGVGAKAVANGERHGVAGLVPLIAAGRAVEDARRGANRGLAVSKRIPCKTDTRRNVAERRADDAATDAFVPREQHAKRRARSNSGLLVGNKRRRPVMGIDGRRIDVPAESKVGRETGRDAVVVLCKCRDVPSAQMRDISRVLLK